MSLQLINALIFSLVLTIALEVFLFLLIVRKNKKDLMLVVLVNIVTNPIVVLLYWLAFIYTPINTVFVKVVLELFAVSTEAFYYKRYGKNFKYPIGFSVIANSFSFLIGVFIQMI